MKDYGHRRLQVTVPGRWYLALTIIFGVVAISSENNVLYLLESLLLGGLILSGVLSEHALASVRLEWHRRRAWAGTSTTDDLRVTNKGWLPILCLEVGEWKDGRLRTRAVVPYLGPREARSVAVTVPYDVRGSYRWDGLACATRYPFGFARKIRWVREAGSRTVWPKRVAASRTQVRQDHATRRGSGEVIEGEVRELQASDDYRDVVWTLSVQLGEPVARVRGAGVLTEKLELDLRAASGMEFERRISELAWRLHAAASAQPDAAIELALVGANKVRRVEGYARCLDALAQAKAEGA